MANTAKFSTEVCYSVFWILFWCAYNTQANEECFQQLSTDVYPAVINYTGGNCTWNITAPGDHRVALTIDTFRLLTVLVFGSGEDAFYELSDEVGYSGPHYVGSTGYTFHSEGSYLIISLKIAKALTYTEAELVATIRKVDEKFVCDFEENADCTREVSGESEWIHGRDIAKICPERGDMTTSIVQGLFFNNPSLEKTKLFSRTLEGGEYLVEIDTIWGCAGHYSLTVLLRVTFCQQMWNRTIDSRGYYRGVPLNLVMRCDEAFEVTFEAAQTTDLGVIIAVDRIRISKIFEQVPRPTTTPAGTTADESDSDAKSDADNLAVIIGGAAAAVVVAVVLAILVCVCLCRRKGKPKTAGSRIPVAIDNKTYDLKIPVKLPERIKKRLPSYNEVTETDTSSEDKDIVVKDDRPRKPLKPVTPRKPAAPLKPARPLKPLQPPKPAPRAYKPPAIYNSAFESSGDDVN